jgi:hypothetical protein
VLAVLAGAAVSALAASAPAVSRTLVEHFDGHAWSIVRSPNLGAGSNYLTGLAVLHGQPWAVGRADDGARYRPLALHRTGSGCFGRLLRRSGAGDEALNAVAAVGHTLWAVGGKTDAAGRQRTLTMRYRGGRWTVAPSPNLGRQDNVLYSVVANGKVVWAVGNATTRALTMRRPR